MNYPLSPEQHKFLTKYRYIRLSEWRLLAQNSSRVLNPTGDGSWPPKWFYVGSPPYTLNPFSGSPMEKPCPKEPNRLVKMAAALSGQTIEENQADAERLLESFLKSSRN